MNRRDFLKYSGLLGLGGALPALSSFNLFAAHDGYAGPLWLNIDARGGWDPTSFCDPKGYTSAADPARLNNYPASAIQTIANSPIRIAPAYDGYDTTVQPYLALDFFQKYKDRLLIINGIDHQTNSHSDGQRYSWSCKLATQGYTNIAALIAADLAGEKAMPFITSGGYSLGANLLTPIQIKNRALSALLEIAYPNRSGSQQNSSSPTYFPENVFTAIKTSRDARLTSLRSEQRLQRIQTAIDNLANARQSTAHMTELVDFIEANPASKTLADFNNRSAAYNAYVQGHFALAAYKVGVTASAQISISGFDTHSDHDARHYPRLLDYLQAVDAILDEAALPAFGLADSLVVSMGSDFGRTNKYNAGAGKDHWPITSMMFMGNSQQVIRGNRVIGQTTDNHKAINIDPVTLEADVNDTNPNSARITPAHIHRALRNLAGIQNSANAAQYSLDGQDIDLFS